MKFLLGSGYAIVPISDTTILFAVMFAVYVSPLRNLLLWIISPGRKFKSFYNTAVAMQSSGNNCNTNRL